MVYIISFFVYMPFVRRLDKDALVAEQNATANADDDDW